MTPRQPGEPLEPREPPVGRDFLLPQAAKLDVRAPRGSPAHLAGWLRTLAPCIRNVGTGTGRRPRSPGRRPRSSGRGPGRPGSCMRDSRSRPPSPRAPRPCRPGTSGRSGSSRSRPSSVTASVARRQARDRSGSRIVARRGHRDSLSGAAANGEDARNYQETRVFRHSAAFLSDTGLPPVRVPGPARARSLLYDSARRWLPRFSTAPSSRVAACAAGQRSPARPSVSDAWTSASGAA